MVEAALGRVTGWLNPREVLSLFVPGLAFWGVVGLLVVHRVGWPDARQWWTGLDGVSKALLSVAVAGGILVFTLVLGQALLPLNRLFEGYWTLGRLGRWLSEQGRARQQRRWDDLSTRKTPAAYRLRYQRFPVTQAEVMPTRLGNVLRAAESYAADPRRYGIDPVFFWPRLYSLLPEPLRTDLATARAEVDRMLVTATLSFALAIGAAVAGGAAHLGWPARAVVALGSLGLGRLAYLGACWAAVPYAELVRSSFDVYRRDLLAAMGLLVPETLPEERALWKALGQQLYRRGADEESRLRFRS
jgi:hypothetical protein